MQANCSHAAPTAARPHAIVWATAAVERFCPGFLSAPIRASLVTDGLQLPDCYDWVAFESRLDVVGHPVDLSISVSRAKARAFLAALTDAVPTRIREPLEGWALGGGEPALRRITNAWLEFDHADTWPGPPWNRGFCFLGLDGGPHPRGEHSLIPPLSRALGCRNASAWTLASRIESLLPRGAQMLNIATLDHRGAPELRLHFSLPRTQVWTTLPALGWQGCGRTLAELLELYEQLGLQRVAIQLALDDGLKPGAGFELYLPHHEAQERWRRVGEWLQRRGMLEPRAIDWLPNWQGRSTLAPTDFPNLQMPAHVDILRKAHVKFTIDRGGLTSAKAYLFAASTLVPF